MKLNNDLIRVLLLEIEDKTDFNVMFTFDNSGEAPVSKQLLSTYSVNEIRYHINQMIKSDLIEVYQQVDEFVVISDLTPFGHEFISNIRSNNIWSKTKSIAEIVGSKSLDALVNISSGVIAKVIEHELGYL